MRIGDVLRTYLAEPVADALPGASARAEAAPDYAEATVGWRSWFVLRVDGRLRLSSTCYSTLWEPGRAAEAACRYHPAPEERCRCGIYASRSPRQAAPFLVTASRPRIRAVGRVLGRVALWGTVVECEDGWRGALGYPLELHVPAVVSSETPAGRGAGAWWQPRYLPAPAEELEAELGAYGAPVALLTSHSVAAAAWLLEVRAREARLESPRGSLARLTRV